MVQWFKNLPCDAVDAVSIPDQGTEILHVVGQPSSQLLSPSATAKAPHSRKQVSESLCLSAGSKSGNREVRTLFQ